MTRKAFAILAIMIFIAGSQLTGCSPKKTGARQIAPFARENIQVISVNRGNSMAKNIINQDLINTIIGELDHIQFSRMNTNQEADALDHGRVFNLE
jgi:hypothetical protein